MFLRFRIHDSLILLQLKYQRPDGMDADVRAAGSSKAFTQAMYDLGKQLLEKARKGSLEKKPVHCRGNGQDFPR